MPCPSLNRGGQISAPAVAYRCTIANTQTITDAFAIGLQPTAKILEVAAATSNVITTIMPLHRYLSILARFLWVCSFVLLIPYWIRLLDGPSMVGLLWLISQPHGEASPLQLELYHFSYALGIVALLLTSAGVIFTAETRKRTARQVLLVDLIVFVASQIINLILHHP